MQKISKSDNYVMTRQSLTFFVQLGNDYTFNSQNLLAAAKFVSAISVTRIFIPLIELKCV